MNHAIAILFKIIDNIKQTYHTSIKPFGLDHYPKTNVL